MAMLSQLLEMAQKPMLMEPKFSNDFFQTVTQMKHGAIKDAGLFDLLFAIDEPESDDDIDNVAIIRVHGGLSHRTWWRYNYQEIGEQFRSAMEDASVKHIVFDLNTPGGEVSGAFDLSDVIYEARGTKPITGLVADRACSAGYLIAAACDEVVVSRTSEVGSIGVVATHIDESSWWKKQGVVHTYVVAGEHKVDFASTKPLSAEANGRLQNDVDDLYELFVESVSKYRNMSADEIIATQAMVYQGERALEVGLADRIESFDASMQRIMDGDTKPDEAITMLKDKPADKKAADATTEKETVVVTADQPTSVATTEEVSTIERSAECADIMELCSDAGVSHLAANYIRADYSLAVVKEKINGIKQIREMCKLVKADDEKSEEFIRQGMSVEDVKTRLLEYVSSSDGGEIDNTASPEAVVSHESTDKNVATGWDSAFKQAGASLKG